MNKKHNLKIGDIFEMTLSDHRKAYGQYIYWDKKMGPLVQIFDLIFVDEINLEDLAAAKPLFPPVITGLFAAVKTGLWNVIGNFPVKDFKYHPFVSTLFDQKTGEARIWFLWDGEKSIKLGYQLTASQKQLEYLTVWNPPNLMKRIETGEYPFPYGDLIQNNKFIPNVL